MNILKKSLAIAVIFLFIGGIIFPSINANINKTSLQEKKIPSDTEMIEVKRLEYKSDGKVEKTTIEIPKDRLYEFQNEVRSAKTIDEKLGIYKKYDLIPNNISIDTLRKNFNEYVERVNMSKTSIENYAQNFATIKHLKNVSYYDQVLNTMCIVDGEDGLFSLRFDLGLSPIIGRINFLIYSILLGNSYKIKFPQMQLPSADFLMVHYSGLGDIVTNGLFGEKYCVGIGFFLLMVGFVGFVDIIPLLFDEVYLGFTMLTFAQSNAAPPQGPFHHFMNLY